jgi:hypothetical protein
MPKAVKVTKENKNHLVDQYNLDEDYLDDMLGMWLVADFGESEAIHGLLLDKGFNELFEVTDAKLANGYVEIKRKS